MYCNRGIAYGKLGEHQRAIEDFDRAIALDPEYAAAYYNKACTFALMGRVDEAITQLRKAVEFDEEFRDLVTTDEDFDGIRDDARFRSLIGDLGQ